MVDSISSALVARLRLQETTTSSERSSGVRSAAGSVAIPAPAGADRVEGGAGSVSQTVSEMVDKGPPVDLETVRRIKEAIAEGNYPINVDRITESIFEGLDDVVSA